MERKPIENAWKRLEALALSGLAKPAKREMRKAFLAGATAVFRAVLDAADWPEEAAEQLFADMEREIEAFGEELARDARDANASRRGLN